MDNMYIMMFDNLVKICYLENKMDLISIIYKCLQFPVSLCVVTLHNESINFVMCSPVHFTNDYLNFRSYICCIL